MALDQREKELLDAIIKYAQSENELEDTVGKILPSTINPPNPDFDALGYYKINIQSIDPAKQIWINNLCKKWGI